MRTLLTLFTFLVFFNQSGIAQEDILLWEKAFDQSTKRFSNCLVVEGADGNLGVFAPTTDQLLAYWTIDKKGSKSEPQFLEFPKSTLKAVIAHDSGYFLVGSLKEKGKTYPALWKMEGKQLELVEMLPLKGCFNDLLINQGDTLLMTGVCDDKLCLYQFDVKMGKLDQFYLATESGSEGRSIIQIRFDEYVVTGLQKVNKIPQLTAWQFNEYGAVFRTYLSNMPYTSGEKILQLENTDLFIAGMQYTDTLVSNVLIKLPSNLLAAEITKQITAPDARIKYGTAAIENFNNQLLLGGVKSTFLSRSTKIWINRFSSSDWTKYRESPGPNSSDFLDDQTSAEVTDLIRLKNEDYVLVCLVEKGNNTFPMLFYYQLENNPCSVGLQTMASKDSFHFMPARDADNLISNHNYTFSGHLISPVPLRRHQVKISSPTYNFKGGGALELPPTLNLTMELGEHGYCYFVEKELALEPFDSLFLKLEIAKGGQTLYSDTIKKKILTRIPNLHLITIGINSKSGSLDSLEWAGQDARDLDSLFRMQEGRLFKRVFNYTFHTAEQTKATTIIDFLAEFCSNKVYPKVEEEDMLLLFISSHGEVMDDDGKKRFVLPAEGYDPNNKNTYVDYEKDLIANLGRIPGKKVVLIDACKSGSADYAMKGGEQPEQELIQEGQRIILNSGDGFIVLASSQDSVPSVECPKLKNGAFTAAVKEALNQENPAFKVDQNQDKLVTIQELFDYLKLRVPKLAKVCVASQDQVPQLKIEPGNESLRQIPIFFLNQ